MAFQKGPGDGYMAAKDAALAIARQQSIKLKCRLITRVAHYGARPDRIGFVVEDKNGKTIGKGTQARDAWGDAYFKLGGTFPVRMPLEEK